MKMVAFAAAMSIGLAVSPALALNAGCPQNPHVKFALDCNGGVKTADSVPTSISVPTSDHVATSTRPTQLAQGYGRPAPYYRPRPQPRPMRYYAPPRRHSNVGPALVGAFVGAIASQAMRPRHLRPHCWVDRYYRRVCGRGGYAPGYSSGVIVEEGPGGYIRQGPSVSRGSRFESGRTQFHRRSFEQHERLHIETTHHRVGPPVPQGTQADIVRARQLYSDW